MSELGKLIGTGKKIKLGELELDIKPLTVSAVPLLMELGNEDKSKQAAATLELVKLTLKDSLPDATNEEIEKLPLEHLTTIMEAILDVNKLGMSDDKKELINRLKK